MRWQDREQSTNVEDRRRSSPGPVAMGGGIGTILLLVVMYFMGADPKALLDMATQGGQQQGTATPGAAGEELNDEMKQFVSVVLADTEKVWRQQFQKMGQQYVEPTLVMFSGQVRSACGHATAATGPFYCPGDQKVYIDFAFFDELKQRFKAPGDFAQAYVIAHEIGHHVQKLLGITDQVDAMRGRISEEEYNQLSVRLELQADFFAGMWAHHAEKQWHILERGDMEEALNAATAIGDDRLQHQAQGYVVPESFTHGTSAQRVR